MTKVVYEPKDTKPYRYTVQMRSEGTGWYGFDSYPFKWMAKFTAWFLSDSRFRARVVDNRD